MKLNLLSVTNELMGIKEIFQLLDVIMDRRAIFASPDREIILQVEIIPARLLKMDSLVVENLRIPFWKGLPENPVGFRDRKNPTPSADAG